MTKNPQKLCQSTVEMFTTWKFAMLVRPQLLLHLVLVFSLELFLLAVVLVVPGALQQDPDRARHQAHREAPQHEENNPEEDHEGPAAGLCSGAASC